MFLAALDQTIVRTAIRTIGDDLNGLYGAGLGHHRVPDHLDDRDAALRQALRHLRPQAALPVRDRDVHHRLGAVRASRRRCTCWPAFRAFQGIGAGGLFSLALAIMGDIIPPRERAKYQGYFLAVFATSSVLGPVVGGFLAGQNTSSASTGWRWIFLHQRPDRHRRARRRRPGPAPRPPAQRSHRIDWWGASRSSSAWCRC